jgi:hypothetical protein
MGTRILARDQADYHPKAPASPSISMKNTEWSILLILASCAVMRRHAPSCALTKPD